MADTDEVDEVMTQGDMAMLSAVKVVIDILLRMGPGFTMVQPKAFDLRLKSMEEVYAAQGDLKAAELLRLLRVFANDPVRQAAREERRKFEQTPPVGSA